MAQFKQFTYEWPLFGTLVGSSAVETWLPRIQEEDTVPEDPPENRVVHTQSAPGASLKRQLLDTAGFFYRADRSFHSAV